MKPGFNTHKPSVDELAKAARKNDTVAALDLLQRGADINEKDKNEQPALFWAIDSGHMDMVKLLLAHGALVESKDKNGLTALMCAGGHMKIARLLLDKGADVNGANNYGVTALMFGAQLGAEDYMRLLIERGADLDKECRIGYTVHDFAQDTGYSNILQLLQEAANPDCNPLAGVLIKAVREGNLSAIQDLVQRGADINEKDGNGKTMVMLALHRDHPEVAAWLIERGVSVDEKDKDGNTALMRATGHVEIARLVFDKGAKVDEADNYGVTALMFGAQLGAEEYMRLLIERGADIDRKSNNGATVHDFARGHRGAAQLLQKAAEEKAKEKKVHALHETAQENQHRLKRLAGSRPRIAP
jgi:ankyrin repeat protein